MYLKLYKYHHKAYFNPSNDESNSLVSKTTKFKEIKPNLFLGLDLETFYHLTSNKLSTRK